MPSRKLTIKTVNPVGKWKSFSDPYHEIKLGGEWVGSIDNLYPHQIRLMVLKNDIHEDGNPNCKWKWRRLLTNFESVSDAKNFIKENNDLILKKYNFPIKNNDNAKP